MKQVPLYGDWSLALHVRDDGERLGVILRANTVQAEFLCLIADERAFAIVRFPRAGESTGQGRDIRGIFEPVRSPLGSALHRTIEESLSRELGLPTQLVISPFAGKVPMRVITVPPRESGAPG